MTRLTITLAALTSIAYADCDMQVRILDYTAGAMRGTIRLLDTDGTQESFPTSPGQLDICAGANVASGVEITVRLLPGTPKRAQSPPAADVHQELAEMYKADQADRPNNVPAPGMADRDAGRRQRVVALLKSGRLETADDFHNAAMILHHGDKPDEYLLAHVLATLAGLKGRQEARSLAALALDRFLWSTGRPQIFGTQFRGEIRKMDQAPYDAGLLPEIVRKQYGIPTAAELMKTLPQAVR